MVGPADDLRGAVGIWFSIMDLDTYVNKSLLFLRPTLRLDTRPLHNTFSRRWHETWDEIFFRDESPHQQWLNDDLLPDKYFKYLPGMEVPSKTSLRKMHEVLMQALMKRPIVMTECSSFILRWTSSRPLICSLADDAGTAEAGKMVEFKIAPEKDKKTLDNEWCHNNSFSLCRIGPGKSLQLFPAFLFVIYVARERVWFSRNPRVRQNWNPANHKLCENLTLNRKERFWW